MEEKKLKEELIGMIRCGCTEEMIIKKLLTDFEIKVLAKLCPMDFGELDQPELKKLKNIKREIFEIFVKRKDIEDERKISFAVCLVKAYPELLNFIKDHLKSICSGKKDSINYLSSKITEELGERLPGDFINQRAELSNLVGELKDKIRERDPSVRGIIYVTPGKRISPKWNEQEEFPDGVSNYERPEPKRRKI